MWNRQQVKQQAKTIMKRNYWRMFVITLLAGVLTGEDVNTIQMAQDFVPNDILPGWVSSIFTFFSMGTLIGLLYSIFIGFAIKVGKYNYFIKNHNENPSLNEIVQGFKGNYLNVLKIMFIMHLKIMLWLILFVVPGIIKAYEYSMIPYLLAEDPNITTEEAFSLSEQMTNGQKINLFVLDLSFLGWYFLGFLCLGIGVLFVRPYEEATSAEVYLILKESIKKNEDTTRGKEIYCSIN